VVPNGIIVVNRWDSSREAAFPLKIYVSADNKNWQEIASFDKPQDVITVNLAGKNLEIQYVKFESQHPAGTSGALHFRRLLVYGKTLY